MAFNRLMLTTSGKTLYAKAQQGKPLRFTRAAVGDGQLGSGSLVNRTVLISEKLSLLIDAIQLTADATETAVLVTLKNNDLAQGFYFRELGLFAEDPDTKKEVLYLYDNAGGDAEYIPDANGNVSVHERFKLLITLENTPNVTFQGSGNPLYLSIDDINDEAVSLFSMWSSKKTSDALELKVDTAMVEAKLDAHNSSHTSHGDMRTALTTAQQFAQEAKSIAEGRSRAVSYTGYSTMAAAVNLMTKTAMRVGDNLLLETLGVPDLWVSKVEAVAVVYAYTTDEALEAVLENGPVQIGYYKLSMLETPKVDLSGYVLTRRTINGKALTADVTLTAEDVGARPNTWNPAWSDVQSKPDAFPPEGHTHPPTDLESPVPVSKGGTGATTEAAARQAMSALTGVGPTTITVPVSGWTGTGPWVQTVSVSGVTAADTHLHLYKVTVTDAAARKLYDAAVALLDDNADTVAGGIKLTCYDGKPETTFQLSLEGARV